jgi:ribosomal protein L16 Arg81 hydroxylase
MNIAEFINTISEIKFFTSIWQKKSYVFSNKKLLKNFNFDINDFYKIIDFSNLEFPDLVCLNKHGQVIVTDYTNITPEGISNKIVPRKVYNTLNQFNTIRIRGVDKYNLEIKKFKNKIEKIFNTKITINGYLSGANNMGINPHYDTHDIFIIQLHGSKKWELGNVSNITPTQNFRPDMYDKEKFTVNKNVTLKYRDMLYLPKGMWHQTKTDDVSFHLSVGIHVKNASDIIHEMAEYLLNNNSLFRQSLIPSLKGKHVEFKPSVNINSVICDAIKNIPIINIIKTNKK